MQKDPKPVTLVTTNAFKMDERHYAVGEIAVDVPYDTAVDLVGAARARLATDDDIAAAAKAAKAVKA